MLIEAMADRGETLEDIVFNTMSEDEMTNEFDDGFGTAEGIPFTVWTHNTVYFPVEYDGSDTVGSVARNPDGKATVHI